MYTNCMCLGGVYIHVVGGCVHMCKSGVLGYFHYILVGGCAHMSKVVFWAILTHTDNAGVHGLT